MRKRTVAKNGAEMLFRGFLVTQPGVQGEHTLGPAAAGKSPTGRTGRPIGKLNLMTARRPESNAWPMDRLEQRLDGWCAISSFGQQLRSDQIKAGGNANDDAMRASRLITMRDVVRVAIVVVRGLPVVHCCGAGLGV